MGKVIRPFCWHQNFVLGAVCHCPGLYTCIKSWTNLYKIRLQRDFFFKLATNDRSDKMFLLTSKFYPLRIVSPCPGAVYMYKIMKKKCIKPDFKEIVLKLVANYQSDKRFLLTSKLCPLGLSAANIHLSNHEKMCIKLEVEEILFKLATNDHSDKAFLLI